MGRVFDSVPLCTIPIPGIKELTVLVLILLTAYIDIYCERNQKPVPSIPREESKTCPADSVGTGSWHIV